MKIIQEFKEFALKGSVIDLAVGIIIGAAFGAVVKSLVDNVLMPPLGYLIGRVDFSQLSVNLPTPTGDPVLVKYGLFLNACISFLIQAVAIFLIIKVINTARREKEEKTEDEPQAPELTTQERLLTEIRDAIKREAAAKQEAGLP